jgi:SAM-dependent methyltransferase
MARAKTKRNFYQEIAKFDPSMYDVASLEEAKGVILGPEEGQTVDERWERETPYLGKLIEKHLRLKPESVLLDYGCGVGRLSWEAIRRTGCRAIGVDASVNMRALAASYAESNRFLACHEDMLELMPPCDAAIAVWILQHCVDPLHDIDLIASKLKPGARLFVLNDHRLVPTDRGFVRDGKDVTAMLDEYFHRRETIALDADGVGKMLEARAFCAIYEMR